MTFPEFQLLKVEIEDSLKISKDNISEKSISVPYSHSKYINIFSREFKLFRDLSIKKDKLYGKLYHYYKFDFNYSLSSKTEIEPYINNNDEYYKLLLEMNEQEEIVKYLEKIVKVFEGLSFSIKNFIEYQKFISGN